MNRIICRLRAASRITVQGTRKQHKFHVKLARPSQLPVRLPQVPASDSRGVCDGEGEGEAKDAPDNLDEPKK